MKLKIPEHKSAKKWQVPVKPNWYTARITKAEGYEEPNEKFGNYPHYLYPVIELDFLITEEAENRLGNALEPETFTLSTLVSLDDSDYEDSKINQLLRAIFTEETSEVDPQDFLEKELKIQVSVANRFNRINGFSKV